MLTSRFDLLQLTTKEKIDEILSNATGSKGETIEDEYSDDTIQIAKLFKQHMKAEKSGDSNICFMDMRGEKSLEPQDSERFEFYIFGGILGDHPP